MRFLFALLAVAMVPAQETQDPVFGTTVYAAGGFEGLVYKLEPETQWLPDFKKLTAVGKLYTDAINVPPQTFETGFPGISEKFELFAIAYSAFFYVREPVTYQFGLISDDGSKLFIDGKLLIDNDGLHVPRFIGGRRKLTAGTHSIRVEYFQGRRPGLALQLGIGLPGKELQVFRCRNFQPPRE